MSPPVRSPPSVYSSNLYLFLLSFSLSPSPASLPLSPVLALLLHNPSLWQSYFLTSKVISTWGRHFPTTILLLNLNPFFLLWLNVIPLERLLLRHFSWEGSLVFLTHTLHCVHHSDVYIFMSGYCLRAFYVQVTPFWSRNCSDSCLSSEVNTVPSA